MTKKKNQPPADRTREQSRAALRKKVRMFYDLQRLRMQCAGRTKKKGEGAEVQLHEVDQAILDARAKNLHDSEKLALKDITQHLKTMPMWTDVLKDTKRFKGLGPTMAGVILSEFDIYREETASQMWSFAGLAPIPARRCKLCHDVLDKEDRHPKTGKCEHKGNVLLASQSYASGKAMRPTKGEKLPYNAFLKTKMVGVLGSCLLKANSPWRKFYDDYKHRKESAGWGKSDGHRHNAAVRYMVKMLLLEIHKEWRTMEGLPLRPSYQEEYLQHRHAS